MTNKKVLISGAGIAGLTLAYWLTHYGFSVTVVEQFPELRMGGQNIDVKGPALEVAFKMNIVDQIRAANTTEQGLRWVNTKNQIVAEFPKEESLSLTQEYEILRGDLVQILYDQVKDNTEFRFGHRIISLQEKKNSVSVTFADGAVDEFDLVIPAEGIGSRTRDMIFNNEVKFNYKGVYTSYFTIAADNTDSTWARWCNAAGGIVYILRPDNYGNTRASVNFLSPENGYEKLPLNEQKEILISKIQGTGWESKRLITEIEQTKDLYLDRLSQVKVVRWSKGRSAIVGDAAHCATPLSGKGTDLAMSGPYILAGELWKAKDHITAFENYETLMKPFAESCQRLPPGVPRLVYPTSSFGVSILNGFVSLIGSRVVKSCLKLLKPNSKKSDTMRFTSQNSKGGFRIPEYD